ncbi:hypothetical protein [Spartinivicinus poritis]|uniref:Uncharacterized protein n=1 Tax=Spartinivicinus poritis TaxID=2994640 RepID=A0ABT5U961_9GAMM|nr:hypothetical protein [Spartinivicinus sp. A2-2]MDE1462541.1 hypothetical protein [Spartinivicinus sp. A2-2]
MKKIAKKILTTAALISAAFVGNAMANNYLPMTIGDYVVYQGDKSNQQIPSKVVEDDGTWKYFKNFGGLGDLWLHLSDDNKIYVWSEADKKVQLFVDLNSAEGNVQKVGIAPCNNGEVTITSRAEEVKVPAGAFDNIIKLSFRNNCADAGVTELWLAPEVGVVKWSETSIMGPRDYQMVHGNVLGNTYPKK